MNHMSKGPRDVGSASLELVIWAPVLLLVAAVIVLAGRVAQATQAVEVAAAEAARAASAAGTHAQATARAESAATAALSSAGLRCSSTSVTIDTTEWSRPAGAPARVSAQVDCRLGLADLSIPGVPGAKDVSATASSALDRYRVRS
jgi:Flp pilus assembly protein TadG